MDNIYTLYAIRCIINNDTFIGITKNVKSDYNPIKFFLNVNKKDRNKYVKITESVNKYKAYNHKIHIIKSGISLVEANNHKNFILSNIKYNVLNDEYDSIKPDFNDLDNLILDNKLNP